MTKTLTDRYGDRLRFVQQNDGKLTVGIANDGADTTAGPFTPADLYAAIEAETGEAAHTSVIHDGGAYWKGEYERVAAERDRAESRGHDYTPCTHETDSAWWQDRWKEAADQRDEAKNHAALWKETARREVRKVHDEDGLVMRAVRAAKTLATGNGWLRDDLANAEQERDEARADVERIRGRYVTATRRAVKAEAGRDEAIKARDGWHDLYLTTRAERDEARASLDEANETVKSLRAMTAADHYAAGWDAAHPVPDGATIPAGTPYVVRYHLGSIDLYPEGRGYDNPTGAPGFEYRTLDPLPTARSKEAEALTEAIDAWTGMDFTTRPSLADHLAAQGWTKGEQG